MARESALGRYALAALAVGVVVLLVLGAVAAVAEPVTHVHQSSRYSRSAASLDRSLARDLPGASIATLTEIGDPPRTGVLHNRPGWHALTRARVTDLGIMWRASRWRLVAWDAHRLAPGPPRDTWALSAVLAPRAPHTGPRVLVSTTHMPSGVEYGAHWSPFVPVRVARWKEAARDWRTRVAALRRHYRPGLVLVVSDWNVNIRLRTWRRIVRAAFPTLRLTWHPLPHRATFGKGRRVIDATLTNGTGRAHLLRRTPASDHTPYRETLYAPRPSA